MGKLNDLRVERVDGVDKPATGKQFIIVKREDQTVDALAKTAVEAILDGDVSLSEEQAAALGDLAKALELDVEVKTSEAPAEPEPAAKAEPAAPEADAKPEDEVGKDEEFVDVEIDGKPAKVAKSVLGDLLKDAMAEAQGDEPDAPKAESLFRGAGASTRARGQDEIEKSGTPPEAGKGLHRDWVFRGLE